MVVFCFFFFSSRRRHTRLVRSRGLGDVYKRQEQSLNETFKSDLAASVEDKLKNANRDLSVAKQALSLIHI